MYVSPAAMCVELGNPGGLRCELGLKVARVGVVLEDWHMRRLQRARQERCPVEAAEEGVRLDLGDAGGHPEAFARHARAASQALEPAAQVLTGDPICAWTMRMAWPERAGVPAPTIRHLAEVAANVTGHLVALPVVGHGHAAVMRNAMYNLWLSV